MGGVENYINKQVPDLLNRNWQVHYFAAKIEQPILPGMILHKIQIIRGSPINSMFSFALGKKRKDG